MDDARQPNLSQLVQLLTAGLNSPLVGALGEVWKLGRKVLRGLVEEGLYEVLEYESVLELHDKHGERAIVRKRQRVRYLQNNIIAYQDQAWGDGEILINYRCTPGMPVDQYRPDKKTYILISLREVKSRGDEDEFNIEWGIHNGFARRTESWAADVSHRTRHLKCQVIFPASRPPLRASIVQTTSRKANLLSQEAFRRLPNGRYVLEWECDHPRLYETYALQWDW